MPGTSNIRQRDTATHLARGNGSDFVGSGAAYVRATIVAGNT